MAERGLGIGRRSGRAPHRQPVERGEQHEQSGGPERIRARKFNQRYEGLMRYYGVKPQHTNPASPNENGDAEQSHHRFKRAVEQALLLRGSREFGSLAEYAQFLKDLFWQRDAGRRARVKVDSGSLIHVERNAYSVNSRLIGARVEARSYLDHTEVWYGQRKVE